MRRISLALLLILVLVLTAAAAAPPLRIAIIDTGIATAAIDATQLAEGRNYIRPQDGTQDKIGHGTAIAGILVGSKAAGLAGVFPGAALVPLVYFSQDENGKDVKGDTKMVAQAVYDAIDVYGCRIINCSSGTTTDTDSLRQAVQYAKTQDVLLVACAGNGNLEAPAARYYPAAYESVLCVGAANPDGSVASFSQRGETVDILAPGTNLWVANIRGNKFRTAGTSYATAYVSGAAAALLAAYPALTAAQVRQILCASARDIGAVGFDEDSGWGILNAEASLVWAAQNRRFRDVPPEMWCFDAVNAAAQSGLISGTDLVHFSPARAMSRGMLFTILHRMSGDAPTAQQAGDTWYTDAMMWAQVSGITDGENPNGITTREQFAAMLYRYAGVPATAGRALPFVDSGKVSDWAVDALCWAVDAGILSGRGGNVLDPKGSTTRAEATAMLQRYIATQ